MYFEKLVYQIMDSDKFKLQGKPEAGAEMLYKSLGGLLAEKP